MFTIERIQDKLSAKYDRMNVWSNQNEDKESEKALYIRQINGKWYNYGTYGYMSRYFTEIKENKQENKHCIDCKKVRTHGWIML